jgi:hypothetical protein
MLSIDSVGDGGGVVADQATGIVETGDAGTAATASPAPVVQHLEHTNGRPISWIGVSIAIVGSIIGGVWGFVPQMNWTGFWVGVAVMLVGLIIVGGAKTMSTDWY